MAGKREEVGGGVAGETGGVDGENGWLVWGKLLAEMAGMLAFAAGGGGLRLWEGLAGGPSRPVTPAV
eukprot:g24953.t1